MSADEIGPLSYVTGFVLQSLFRKSKNSLHSSSPPGQELQSLLQSLKLVEAEDDDYIDSLSREGLLYVNWGNYMYYSPELFPC